MADFDETAAAAATEEVEQTKVGDEREEISSNWDECTTTFDSMDLHEDLLRGIYGYGFEKPSAIQQRAVKPMLLGKDVIAQAQSGKFHFHLSCPFASVCMYIQATRGTKGWERREDTRTPKDKFILRVFGNDYNIQYHLSRLNFIADKTSDKMTSKHE
jgi:hypothetical protein